MLLTDEALLARLVAFDSTSCRSNLALADFIADYADGPGVRTARNPSADGSKVNLVISAGPEDRSRRGLMLSGHMDVVPAGEPGWRTDPFALSRAGDSYVARGACDMKGFVALAVNRFAALDPATLGFPLTLVLTYDEELGTLGARRFAETWTEPELLPRAAVIGEPTSLAVVRMHKGHLKIRVITTGVPAHSAYPHLGRNAIEPAGRILTSLAALNRELAAERPAHGVHFEVPFASLNVGVIAGGTAINVVPERCVIELGVRLLPGMSSKEMLEQVRRRVSDAVPDAITEEIGDSPPMVLDDHAEIYRHVAARCGQSATRAVSFATDASWLQRMGVECVICGPGSIEVAHKPNEFIPVGEFVKAGELVGDLVRSFTAGP
jgi:acetylornithine deacetylase